MNTKEAIRRLVDALDEEKAASVRAYARAIAGDDPATEDETNTPVGQPRPIEWMKVGQPTSEDDPLWRIVGMIGDEYDGPTDVARSHDRYLSDEAEDRDEVDEQMAEAAPGRLTLDDPLWNIVGIGRTAEPTNVAKDKDEYLADAFDTRRP